MLSRRFHITLTKDSREDFYNGCIMTIAFKKINGSDGV